MAYYSKDDARYDVKRIIDQRGMKLFLETTIEMIGQLHKKEGEQYLVDLKTNIEKALQQYAIEIRQKEVK